MQCSNINDQCTYAISRFLNLLKVLRHKNESKLPFIVDVCLALKFLMKSHRSFDSVCEELISSLMAGYNGDTTKCMDLFGFIDDLGIEEVLWVLVFHFIFLYCCYLSSLSVFGCQMNLLVNISMWFSMASRLSKNNWSSPPGQDRLLWITNETWEDDLVIW